MAATPQRFKLYNRLCKCWGECRLAITVVERGDDLVVANCGRQFVISGAAVRRVGSKEPNQAPPLVDGHSVAWAYVNDGKRIVEDASMNGVDVLVTSDAPSDGLLAEHPGLVVVSISPLGRWGPYAAWRGSDLIVQALSGYLSMHGAADEAPLAASANILQYAAGNCAYIGAMAALRQRRITGVGQVVEVSWLEAIANLVPFVRAQISRSAERRCSGPFTGARYYPIGDGHLSLDVSDRSFATLLQALGIDEIPERFTDEQARRDPNAMGAYFRSITKGRSARQTFFDLSDAALIPGWRRSLQDVLADPHLEARAFFERRELGDFGTVDFPAHGAKIAADDDAADEAVSGTRTAAERELASQRFNARDRPLQVPGPMAPDDPPLLGVRIIDMTQAWIGPYAMQLLADLGADVIKIENHERPDVWRFGARPAQERPGKPGAHFFNTSANFASTNRNKKSLTLDLTKPRARDLLLELVSDTDILVENFTPHVLEKFDLTWEVLKKVNPALVMASFSGYGDSGPYRDYKSNGVVIEGLAGWDALFGYPHREPMIMGFYQADALTGLQLAASCMAALAARDATGRGQRVTGSMLETAAGYVGDYLIQAQLMGEPGFVGNRHPARHGYGIHRAKGQDSWVAVDAQEALETEWIAEHDAHLAAERLQAQGIAAAPVLDMFEVLENYSEWFIGIDHPDLGPDLYNGFAWRFSRSKLTVHTPPPRLGPTVARS